jgi:hypothetical protein
MRRSDALAGTAMIVMAPVVAWWVVRDLSEEVDPSNANYMIRPLSLSAATELTIGICGSALAAAAVGVLLVATFRGRVEPRWWRFALPLVGLGLYAGVAYRIATAAVIGANIGGGMVVVTAPIVGVTALGLSARNWDWRSGHRRR